MTHEEELLFEVEDGDICALMDEIQVTREDERSMLLGWSSTCQTTPDQDDHDVRLLLQLSASDFPSLADPFFGGAYRELCFFINEDDLRARRYDAAWAETQVS